MEQQKAKPVNPPEDFEFASTSSEHDAIDRADELRKRKTARALMDTMHSLLNADWMNDALCKGSPEFTDILTQTKSLKDRRVLERKLKRICEMCEVRNDCLEFALHNDEPAFVWGGMTEKERRTLRREQSSRTSSSRQ